MIAHLLYMKSIYEKKNQTKLLAKVCVSLLRYCDLIRLDKVKIKPTTSNEGGCVLLIEKHIYESIFILH
jgi:hypothetical protein